MRLSGGHEICFDTEMDFNPISFEPAPSSGGEVRWLWNLPKAKQSLVEGPSFILPAGRHCDLYVIYPNDVQIGLHSADCP